MKIFLFLVSIFFASCKISQTFNIAGTVKGNEEVTHEIPKGFVVLYWTAIVKSGFTTNQIIFQLLRKDGEEYVAVQEDIYGFNDKSHRGEFALEESHSHALQIVNNGANEIVIEFGRSVVAAERWFPAQFNETRKIAPSGQVLSLLLFQNIQVLDFTFEAPEDLDQVTVKISDGGTVVKTFTNLTSKVSFESCFSFQDYTSKILFFEVINYQEEEIKVTVTLNMQMGNPTFPSDKESIGITSFVNNIELPKSKGDKVSDYEYFDFIISQETNRLYFTFESEDIQASVMDVSGKEYFTRRDRNNQMILTGVYLADVSKSSVLRIYNTNTESSINKIPRGIIGYYDTPSDLYSFNVTVTDFRDLRTMEEGVYLSLGESYEILLINGISGIYWSFDGCINETIGAPTQILRMRIQTENENKTTGTFHYETVKEISITQDNHNVRDGRKGLFGDRIILTYSLGPPGEMGRIFLSNDNDNWVRAEVDLKNNDGDKEKWYDFILENYWILVVAGVSSVVMCCIGIMILLFCGICVLYTMIQKYVEDEKDRKEYIPLENI